MVRLNQNSKAVGRKNQNNELKDAKILRADQQSGDNSVFITMSDTKILISAALKVVKIYF